MIPAKPVDRAISNIKYRLGKYYVRMDLTPSPTKVRDVEIFSTPPPSGPLRNNERPPMTKLNDHPVVLGWRHHFDSRSLVWGAQFITDKKFDMNTSKFIMSLNSLKDSLELHVFDTGSTSFIFQRAANYVSPEPETWRNNYNCNTP